eukprot:Skav216572  [mRNA]  locus=scaffold3598:62561:66259:+ [translate_table: standard]
MEMAENPGEADGRMANQKPHSRDLDRHSLQLLSYRNRGREAGTMNQPKNQRQRALCWALVMLALWHLEHLPTSFCHRQAGPVGRGFVIQRCPGPRALELNKLPVYAAMDGSCRAVAMWQCRWLVVGTWVDLLWTSMA